jgi:hypothetical protein
MEKSGVRIEKLNMDVKKISEYSRKEESFLERF